MVVGLYLFTPYLQKVVKYSTNFEILILSAVLLFISMISAAIDISPHHATLFIQMFPLYLGYFFAGHLIFNSNIKIKTYYLIAGFVLFALLTAVGNYYRTLYNLGYNFHQNFSITIIPMSILLMFFIKNIHHTIPFNLDIRKNLAPFSLGAYLIHPAVFSVIKKFHYFGFNQELSNWLIIPLTTFFVTLFSLFIAYGFSKVRLLRRTI